MSPVDVAHRHQREQQELARRVSDEARATWQTRDLEDLDGWWDSGAGARVTSLVAGGQGVAAGGADTYVDDVLTEQGIDATSEGRVVPGSLAGIASDGRDLDSLMYSPVARTKARIGAGASPGEAAAAGELDLDMIVRTQIADAARVGVATALTSRPAASGYVRVLRGTSCSRCAILAGKWFGWNAGFQRHPRCDCIHMPSTKSIGDDYTTNPQTYFDSLSPGEQDRIFTQSGAEAIRLGADPIQVVNARRGMATTVGGRPATRRVFGRDVYATLEGTTLRGQAGRQLAVEGARLQRRAEELATRVTRQGRALRQVRRQRVQVPRLMPEQILKEAADRADAIRLLRRFGYIAPARPVTRNAALRALRGGDRPTPPVPTGASTVAASARAEVASEPSISLRDTMIKADDLDIDDDAEFDMAAIRRETLARVGAVVNGRYGGLQARVEDIDIEFGSSRLHIGVYDGERRVGLVQRAARLDGDRLTVNHKLMQLDRTVQGSGFATEFNAKMYRWYRESGADYVTTHAAIDVGGYTWARAGFDFRTAETAQGVVARLRAAQPRDASERAAVREILDRAERYEFGSDRYPTAYEISQVGRRRGEGRNEVWAGKAALLGADWQGIKWL